MDENNSEMSHLLALLAILQNEAFWGDFQTLCISVMARIHTCKRIEMRGGASLISNLVYKHNRFPFV